MSSTAFNNFIFIHAARLPIQIPLRIPKHPPHNALPSVYSVPQYACRRLGSLQKLVELTSIPTPIRILELPSANLIIVTAYIYSLPICVDLSVALQPFVGPWTLYHFLDPVHIR